LEKPIVDKNVRQEDFEFDSSNPESSFNVGFKPDYFHIVLLSKKTGDIFDQHQVHFGWESPNGVVVTISDYELGELIKNGETETVELKATVGDASDFAETVVAFANQKGGVIVVVWIIKQTL